MFFKVFPELKLRFLWLVIGYALVVLVVYLSLTSNPVRIGMSFPYQDKVFHAFAYFTLMVWFSQIYHDRFQRNMIALVFVLMGVLLEYLQSFDPARVAEYGDFLANLTGVAIGFFVGLTKVRNYLVKIESLLTDIIS